MAGVLVLVVGPSGAGKDTLIGRARAALAGDVRYTFPRRIVTRAAVAELEDHESVEAAEFERQKRRGAYALDWEAHGLRYALPASMDAALVAGRVVVVNVSRQVVAPAMEKYEHTEVVLVTARPEIRAQRLAARGRETADEIAARLKRESDPVPAGLMPTLIDNSGALEVSLRGLLGVLRRLVG